jgi:hypothetical protein
VTLLLVVLGWLVLSAVGTVLLTALCRAGNGEHLDRRLVD